MERKDYFDLANARAKADFISRELSNRYDWEGANLINVAARMYRRDGSGRSEAERMRNAVELLSYFYDDMISPVFEAYI